MILGHFHMIKSGPLWKKFGHPCYIWLILSVVKKKQKNKLVTLFYSSFSLTHKFCMPVLVPDSKQTKQKLPACFQPTHCVWLAFRGPEHYWFPAQQALTALWSSFNSEFITGLKSFSFHLCWDLKISAFNVRLKLELIHLKSSVPPKMLASTTWC